MRARVRPGVRARVQSDCRERSEPPSGSLAQRHKGLERESPRGAQPTGNTRWRAILSRERSDGDAGAAAPDE
jgi:hypothetical protein